MKDIFKSSDKDFRNRLKVITSRGEADTSNVEEAVKDIIADVRRDGDKALFSYTKQFDRLSVTKNTVKVSDIEFKDARKAVSKEIVESLKLAAKRIESFHRRQLEGSWFFHEDDGVTLGQMVRPLERVGAYVPGGKAVYPSSVLMNVIPAKVAGVKEVIVCSPTPGGEVNPYVLVAAEIAGADAVYKVGGAQAVAAMAYGTSSIPKVDKIVGPGNIYVATAKRLVFGVVDIDMIAGPSEILVVADESAKPAFIAADLLSQAEHDEMASSILVTTSKKIADETVKELKKQLKKLSRKEIAEKSLKNYGAIILVKDLNEAAGIVNDIAPEHLELSVDRPFELLPKIRNAGAIFLGHYTPEAVGDYIAGPNHTLPTGGTARFFSPLSATDFLKRSSILYYSEPSLKKIGRDAIRIAEAEGLTAHANSVRVRL
ncbi:MAG: histidinol dehydrogenase [Deltaproteobacteria bacterium]|nr:histidinol dehydrogenase [Deltaproteobacteria bacterium]